MRASVQALSAREIVDYICTEVINLPLSEEEEADIETRNFLPSHSARSTCAALARSGKIFTDSALNALWRRQNSFGPFLALFPADLFLRRKPSGLNNEHKSGDCIWEILRPLIPSDFERAAIYALRVREFAWESNAWTAVSKAFPFLTMSSQGSFLFPHLRLFELTSKYPISDPGAIRSFLPPTLQHIQLHCPATIATISICALLPDSCPNLKHLYISFLRGTTLPGPCISLSLCRLRDLVYVSLYQPTMEAILNLGQLPRLEILKLISLPRMLHPRPPGSESMFRVLRRLHLSQLDIGQGTAFLTLCCDSPLSSSTFFLELKTTPTFAATDAFYDALTTACDHGSVRRLELHFTCHVSPESPPFTMTQGSLTKLACFSALTELHISGQLSFDIDDLDFAKLIAAWPLMESLSMAPCGVDVRPRLTLQSFQKVAQNCPRLRILHVAVDATQIPPNRPVRVTSHSLVDLYIDSSNISNPSAVARFLSGLFPNLVRIWTDVDIELRADDDEPWGAETMQRHDRWRQVEALLPEFRQARREEYAWPASCA
ncbi:hypothetical protein R3P38DRAFT_2597541 [Favolaschia claudopus]|uniref:F-box protein n=1 Tax=Favolaschia claudopus TaxID=2862362 RepID=A0AAW0ECB6_9AGAR